MKYAILSDIHGNQYALKEVLREVDKLQITKLLLLGDYVGYYYGIEQILEQIKHFEYVAIKGNHEELLHKGLSEEGFFDVLDKKYGTSHRRCMKSLSSERIDYLIGLPNLLELKLENLNVLLCHGTPWDKDEYVYPDSDLVTLRKFDSYSFDFIFYGHTHYSSVFDRNGMQVINPGSVGQSREKGGVACWGILDTQTRKFEQMATSYDVKRLEDEVLKYDPGLRYNLDVLRR